MTSHRYRGSRLWIPVALAVLPVAAQVRESATPSSLESGAEQEAFLSRASVVTAAPIDGKRTWRVTLESGGSGEPDPVSSPCTT